MGGGGGGGGGDVNKLKCQISVKTRKDYVELYVYKIGIID